MDSNKNTMPDKKLKLAGEEEAFKFPSDLSSTDSMEIVECKQKVSSADLPINNERKGNPDNSNQNSRIESDVGSKANSKNQHSKLFSLSIIGNGFSIPVEKFMFNFLDDKTIQELRKLVEIINLKQRPKPKLKTRKKELLYWLTKNILLSYTTEKLKLDLLRDVYGAEDVSMFLNKIKSNPQIVLKSVPSIEKMEQHCKENSAINSLPNPRKRTQQEDISEIHKRRKKTSTFLLDTKLKPSRPINLSINLDETEPKHSGVSKLEAGSKQRLSVSEFARLMYLVLNDRSLTEKYNAAKRGIALVELDDLLHLDKFWERDVEISFNSDLVVPAIEIPKYIISQNLSRPSHKITGIELKDEIIKVKKDFEECYYRYIRKIGQEKQGFHEYLQQSGFDFQNNNFQKVLAYWFFIRKDFKQEEDLMALITRQMQSNHQTVCGGKEKRPFSRNRATIAVKNLTNSQDPDGIVHENFDAVSQQISTNSQKITSTHDQMIRTIAANYSYIDAYQKAMQLFKDGSHEKMIFDQKLKKLLKRHLLIIETMFDNNFETWSVLNMGKKKKRAE